MKKNIFTLLIFLFAVTELVYSQTELITNGGFESGFSGSNQNTALLNASGKTPDQPLAGFSALFCDL